MDPSRYPTPLPFPDLWLGSSAEIVAANGGAEVPAQGKRLRLTVSDVFDLQRLVLRSEAANFSIPEFKVRPNLRYPVLDVAQSVLSLSLSPSVLMIWCDVVMGR